MSSSLLPVLACAVLAACDERPRAPLVEGGDPVRGKARLAQYQCTACHEIPEVPGASGGMGPTLAGFGQRSYIAGHIPNEPAKLVAWLRSPQALVPGTAMPDMGVSEADARDMAAYLAALK